MPIQSFDMEDPLEKDTAIHSSLLAWRIPWTEEHGRLYSPSGCKELHMTEGIQPAHMYKYIYVYIYTYIYTHTYICTYICAMYIYIEVVYEYVEKVVCVSCSHV